MKNNVLINNHKNKILINQKFNYENENQKTI